MGPVSHILIFFLYIFYILFFIYYLYIIFYIFFIYFARFVHFRKTLDKRGRVAKQTNSTFHRNLIGRCLLELQNIFE